MSDSTHTREMFFLSDRFYALDDSNQRTTNISPPQTTQYSILQIGRGLSSNSERPDSYSDDQNAPPLRRQAEGDVTYSEELGLGELDNFLLQNPSELAEFNMLENPRIRNGQQCDNYFATNTPFGAPPISPPLPPPAPPPPHTLPWFAVPPPITYLPFSIPSGSRGVPSTHTTDDSLSSYNFSYSSTPQSVTAVSDYTLPLYGQGSTTYTTSRLDDGFNRAEYHVASQAPDLQGNRFVVTGVATAPGSLIVADTVVPAAHNPENDMGYQMNFNTPFGNGNGTVMNHGFEPAGRESQSAPVNTTEESRARIAMLVVGHILCDRGVAKMDETSITVEDLDCVKLELQRLDSEAKANMSGKRRRCLFCGIPYADGSTARRHENITHLGMRFACINETCTNSYEETKDRPERLKEHIKDCQRGYLPKQTRQPAYTDVIFPERISLQVGDSSIWPTTLELMVYFEHIGIVFKTLENRKNGRWTTTLVT